MISRIKSIGRIKTMAEVWRFTALLTVVTVCIPMGTVAVAFALWSGDYGSGDYAANFMAPAMMVAGIIPLLITPPIAYVILNLLRMQGEMIRMVDARIMFDMLTSAYNRNHFLDTIRASETNGPLMIVDADHFKAINDTYGHAIGDEVLRILANVLQRCVGDDGIVGRLGGEEFGVFMAGKSQAEGEAKAEAICAAVRNLYPMISGTQVRLTVSVGCAYHRTAKVIGHTLKEADDLLYRAKGDGRDRAVYLSMEHMLRHSA
jgi:diguanylate cyclase